MYTKCGILICIQFVCRNLKTNSIKVRRLGNLNLKLI